MNIEASTQRLLGMRVTGSFYVRNGQDPDLKAKVRIQHRVYSMYELRALLGRAGWRYVKSYGEFDLALFKPNSKRIIAYCLA